jgi:hypothetical protein
MQGGGLTARRTGAANWREKTVRPLAVFVIEIEVTFATA